MLARAEGPDGSDGQRTLRVMIAAPIVLLLATIAVFAVRHGNFDASISAYYGGPMRDVLVGCLVAPALGLSTFRGSNDLEDLALDAAAFYAPIVAFVPFDLGRATAEPLGADAAGDLKAILGCYLAAAAGIGLFHRLRGDGAFRELWQASVGTRGLMAAAIVALVAELTLLGVRFADPAGTFAGVHLSAAALLVASLAIAVGSHLVARRHRGASQDWADELSPGLTVLYRVVVGGMAIGAPLLGLGLRLLGVASWLFWAETLEITLFLVFWASELRRRWSPEVEASA